jgi:microcystin-dependent protein
MSTGYTRNDTSNNIAEGNVIRASDLDGEFDALQTAFNSSSGHSHDGTSGEGGPITKLGPSQNVTVSASLLGPTSADDTIDLGTSSVQYKDLYIDGTAYIDGLGEDLLVATTAAVQFRDTDLSINSSTDGQLDIDADTELELTSPIVDINASTSVNISNDLKLDSDSAVLSLGADDDVTITHIPDTAVRVNDAIGVQFRDAALSINSSTDGQLDIDADAELEITAPIVDINASTSVNVSNDLKLDSDAAVLSMGADGEVVVTHVADTGIEVKTTNSTTNSTTDVVDVRIETSGSAAAGIGAGIGFTAETGATNFEKIAAIRAVTSDVSAGQEDADLAFHVMQAGTLSEAFRYDAIDDELYVSGKLETTGDVTVGGALGITGGFTADTLTSKSTDTNLTLSGNGTGIVQVNDGLTVTGDLTVSGTTTTVNSTTVSIADANFELASTNNNDGSNGVTTDAVDFGVYGNYNSDPGSANTTAYSGFFRDASDSGKIKFYTGLQAEPTTTVNTSGTGYAEATIVAGSVEVDNLTLNGNAITSTNTDGNITITPNGTGEVDITKVDIDSGAIDGTTIGANSAAAGTFTNLTASTNLTLASGATVTGILDEDNFASDSATALATQQSIKAYIASQLTASTPAGVITPYAGTSAPTGYLLCHGQAVSRTTYADLFSAISTTYGIGDGSSTFNLPDLRGRVVAGQDDMGGTSANRLTNQSGGLDGDTLGATGGAETHTLTTAQLASHSHNISAVNTQASDGTLSRVRSTTEGAGANTRSTETEGSGQAHNNVQPTIILNYIIKT